MKERAKDVKKVFDGISDDARKHISLLDRLIEKFAMSQDQVQAMLENQLGADLEYPELASLEGMTSTEFADLYKKMAEEVKAEPEKFENHLKISGLSEDEMANIFGQIGESIEQYPEIWKSKDDAQMKGPKELAILMRALRK